MTKHIVIKYDYKKINNYIKKLRTQGTLWTVCCIYVEREFNMQRKEAIEAVSNYINNHKE